MKVDLVIVGGGLAGLSLAVALRDCGRRIALLEPHAPKRSPALDTRVYAISPASRAFLEDIGCWRHLDPTRIAPIEAMDVRGDAGGRLRFTAWQACVDRLADIVESSAIACELWETARRQSNLALLNGPRPVTLACADASATLTLDNGETIEASLVVGADGRDSWVREATGLSARDHDYDELGVVANFRCDLPHRGTAYQWFRRDNVLAWLPLPGQDVSIVWATRVEHAQELLALAPAALAEEVAAAGGRQLGRMETLSPASAFPLRLLTVPETIATRCVLIGDAAHGIHPLSGHGVNLGFADAAELARVVRGAPLWQDIGQRNVLRRYQRARREEVWLLQRSTHALHELFGAQAAGISPLRNLGLSAVDRLPFLKSALARYAMG